MKQRLIDTLLFGPYAGAMEVRLKPDLQAKLARFATEQGRDSESLVVEAVERMINCDEWFLQEVEKGIAAADRPELAGG